MTAEDTETLSLPSLAIVTILGYLLYRYFFSPSTTNSNPSSTSRTSYVTGPNGTRYRFTLSQLDTVASMFPQLNRRDIMWDLQRNGGSVQATTERILANRGLDVAPPSFQPILPTPTDPNRPSGVTSLLRGQTKKEEIDLITRYNLQARVKSSDKGKGKASDFGESGFGGDAEKKEGSSGSGSGSGSVTTGTTTTWAATKDARQSILQRRRDEMILEARRKMMERDAARGVSTEQSGDGS